MANWSGGVEGEMGHGDEPNDGGGGGASEELLEKWEVL